MSPEDASPTASTGRGGGCFHSYSGRPTNFLAMAPVCLGRGHRPARRGEKPPPMPPGPVDALTNRRTALRARITAVCPDR